MRCDLGVNFMETFLDLKEAYLQYFKQVKSDVVGGKNRIHHVRACLALVKERKLKRVGNKFKSV